MPGRPTGLAMALMPTRGQSLSTCKQNERPREYEGWAQEEGDVVCTCGRARVGCAGWSESVHDLSVCIFV